MLLLGASIFFITCENCVTLLCKFLSNYFIWSKERFDHMVGSVMLNSTRNRVI